ncbi:MAG: hypothetical protein PHH98_02195 [Candidatus Gracilibacteria bacterium]|nr:hypothetical protein [Candidatus Gracilibacteria bacterium]
MKDFIKKYHNKKLIGNTGIIVTSLVLALGINFFLIDSTSMGKELKTSVLDAGITEIKADLYVENNENNIIIKNSKQIVSPKTISLSLTYNPLELELKNINSKLGEITILGEKNSGFETVLLNTQNNDISANENIIEIETNRLAEKSTGLNMINANFKDISGEQYNLSTSGITF